jgi:hypothetical protein
MHCPKGPSSKGGVDVMFIASDLAVRCKARCNVFLASDLVVRHKARYDVFLASDRVLRRKAR